MSNFDNGSVDELDPEPSLGPALEPSPGHVDLNFESNQDSDLDQYPVGPDGVYLKDQGMSDFDNDSVDELDPETSPGPVDPGQEGF